MAIYKWVQYCMGQRKVDSSVPLYITTLRLAILTSVEAHLFSNMSAICSKTFCRCEITKILRHSKINRFGLYILYLNNACFVL